MDEVAQLILAMALGITVLCCNSTYSSIKDNEAMIEMVKNGADPLKASCAVKGSTTMNQQICHTLVK